jgi:hypothetical protein
MGFNLLTQDEKENKNEIISITEEVLDAEGIECDSKITKVSEEKIREILNEVKKTATETFTNERRKGTKRRNHCFCG